MRKTFASAIAKPILAQTLDAGAFRKYPYSLGASVFRLFFMLLSLFVVTQNGFGQTNSGMELLLKAFYK